MSKNLSNKNSSKNLSKKFVKIIHQNILQKVFKKVVKKLVKKIHQKIHRKNWSNCFSDISNTKIAQCRQKIRRHFSNKVILKLKLSKNKTNESEVKSCSHSNCNNSCPASTIANIFVCPEISI